MKYSFYVYVINPNNIVRNFISSLCPLGSSQAVLRPKTTAEVSELLKYCSSRRLAVVPQGGNTGLVGGSVPVFDEVIISTQLMNDIISLDTVGGK